jgi:hypothetical protein
LDKDKKTGHSGFQTGLADFLRPAQWPVSGVKPAWLLVQARLAPSPSFFLLCSLNFVAPNIFQHALDTRNLMV